MNNRNVYMHGFVCDDAALFLDTHLTVLMHVIYIRKTPHNIIRHENSMLLLANRFFVLMPYLTAVGAGLMNHGHGKEVTANVGL